MMLARTECAATAPPLLTCPSSHSMIRMPSRQKARAGLEKSEYVWVKTRKSLEQRWSVTACYIWE
jgi:hypothetical protein